MNQEGEAFRYLKRKFLHLSDTKIKEGLFVGQQIRELITRANKILLTSHSGVSLHFFLEFTILLNDKAFHFFS